MSDGTTEHHPRSEELSLEARAVRWQTADLLQDRSDVIVADAVAVFPFSSVRRLETDYCVRIGSALLRLVADTVRDGHCEPRSGAVVDLTLLAAERDLATSQFFTFAYLIMTTAIDELSLDPKLGATSDPWPRVNDVVRRAVFDVLSAWTARRIDAPTEAALTDPLTTLHTRPVFQAALVKECQRAERFEHWLSLCLLDVDNLAEINRVHGYGVGDRVLERMGILLRTYFRQHDWVARYAEDAIAVLLPETAAADALTLVERTRIMVRERLTFRDHRTERRAIVTVSGAVVSARALEGEPIDWQRLLAEAEETLIRAKTGGGNRVEHTEILPRLMSIDEAARVLDSNLEGIQQRVARGELVPVSGGRHVRLEREAVMRLARPRTDP